MKINKREFSQEVGRQLKMLRRQLGYSRTEMAEQFGISNNALGKNENGESFPNVQTLHRLASQFDISMDWFLFNKGSMYYKEKKTTEELEKEVARLQKELEQARMIDKETKQEIIEGVPDAEPQLAPDVRELVEHMAKIPLLHYEILAYFHRFKMENKDFAAPYPSSKKRKKSV
ncbi:MAG: helix-turn-helix transcriptional regulator [Candidatus Aminicenantes bacterium]|jgi:transcriptional regulator with XRE-family HTH domain